jgi:hypothetical protein
MRRIGLAMLVAALALGEEVLADSPRGAPPAGLAVVRTGKERLSDKASDEQRVDDCKVPPTKRTHARPLACSWDKGQAPAAQHD